MHIVMSAKEQELLLAFIRNSRRYVEFGSGGSTKLAAQHVKGPRPGAGPQARAILEAHRFTPE
ncbi:MAG TPA: hypothetical protein VL752_17290 [Acidisoma sp.]|jgi:hypothetical protein|uniref:hypothetical protein n=1 Tax=Acidisoma sp. TaxID=1872115 RepID=UPI002CCE8477|nr:hypothetical protein [Acidisoma sp.]HTI02707.1 hypothetical protein [Acidisoma sp.]